MLPIPSFSSVSFYSRFYYSTQCILSLDCHSLKSNHTTRSQLPRRLVTMLPQCYNLRPEYPLALMPRLPSFSHLIFLVETCAIGESID